MFTNPTVARLSVSQPSLIRIPGFQLHHCATVTILSSGQNWGSTKSETFYSSKKEEIPLAVVDDILIASFL